MRKEKLVLAITRLLGNFGESRLRIIYYFILHLKK